MKQIFKQGLFIFYVLTIWNTLQAQDLTQVKFRLAAQKAAENELKIDGHLAENVWQQAEKTTPFWESKPNDKDLAKTQTTAQIAYDSKYLYIAARIEGSNLVSQTRKRDQSFWESESFAVILDPMNRKSNGFFFGLISNNVQCEDLLSSALFRDMNFAWDTKWFSATQIQEGFWTLEMAIPLRILPYKEDKLEWGINFVRPDFNNYQITTWTKVPVNFWPIDLGQTGTLLWDTPPPKPAKNIALIPYTTGNTTQDWENQEKDAKISAGLDARYAITPALNLDLTINPDFSQIEVDAQQTNLGRFNLYFPEKRTFFLENSDIFGDYAIPSFMTPFYSRKIGLDEEGNAIPILFGARLSGNLTPTLRIGAMDMQTGKQDDTPAQNYSAISLNQRILKRSTIKSYFLNRLAQPASTERNLDPMLKYGRNAGVELQYINSSGSLTLNPSYHYSWKEGIQSDNWFYNLQARYRKRNYQILPILSMWAAITTRIWVFRPGLKLTTLSEIRVFRWASKNGSSDLIITSDPRIAKSTPSPCRPGTARFGTQNIYQPTMCSILAPMLSLKIEAGFCLKSTTAISTCLMHSTYLKTCAWTKQNTIFQSSASNIPLPTSSHFITRSTLEQASITALKSIHSSLT